MQRADSGAQARAVRGRGPTRRTAIAVGASSIAALAGTAVTPRSLFVLGDSWAAGLHADPAHALGQVAAAALRWNVQVDAISGTGYVTGAPQQQSYRDRAAGIGTGSHADIAVVQGGSNDRSASPEALIIAARGTLALLRVRLPTARIVMLGPGPDPEPVTRDQQAVDRSLARVAALERVPYVSMLRRRWIRRETSATVLDPVYHHPTVAGQAYLGRRLEESLRHLYPELTGGRAG